MSHTLAKRIQRLKDEIPVRFPNAKLTPVSEDRLQVIMESYPGLPDEYIFFLREIGEGFWYPGEGTVLAPASEFAKEFGLFPSKLCLGNHGRKKLRHVRQMIATALSG